MNRSGIQHFESGERTQKIKQKAISASQRREVIIAASEEREATRIREIKYRLAEREAKKQSTNSVVKKHHDEHILAHRWYLATALASKLAIVKAFFVEQHRMGDIYTSKDQSAIIIQRHWRCYKDVKKQAVVNIAFGVISKLIIRVYARSSPLRLSTSADLRQEMQLLIFYEFFYMILYSQRAG